MYTAKNKEHSEAVQRKTDRTGLPSGLKKGVEALSGYSMDGVRVHYNSDKPARVQALAYTEGEEIHVAPGQERCLPHEAWHVVQQLQGRVRPTVTVNNAPVNDDPALEREADRMGERASGMRMERAENTLISRKPQGGSLQRIKVGGTTPRTIEKYRTAEEETEEKKQKKSEVDHIIDSGKKILGQNVFDKCDISRCNDHDEVKDVIIKIINDNWVVVARALFDANKGWLKEKVDLENEAIRWGFVDDKEIAEAVLAIHPEIFSLMAHHENLDRKPNQDAIDIDDIKESFEDSKSCVITALFKAEEAKFKERFGVEDVKGFHNVLVYGFNKNQYTDDTESTDHQKNNVWKNYSDDSVYPSLYAYFGYISQENDTALKKQLNTAVGDGSLSGKRGMLSLEGEEGGDGHMIFFDLTGTQALFYDNDNKGKAFEQKQNRNKKIKTVYCKRR